MIESFLKRMWLSGTLVSLMVLLAAATLIAEELRFYEPEKVYREEGSKYYRYDEKSIAEEDARSVAEYIYRTYGEDEYPFIYMIPDQQGYYLVSIAGKQIETDYGARFILLRREGKDFVELFYGRGAMDSYILNPFFYSGDTKILILAETGTEYTWGFSAYEFDAVKKSITYLNELPVARVYDGEDSWGELINPLDRARVFIENGRYTIEFDTDIVLDPGGMGERLIESKGGKILFRYNGENFVMEHLKNH
jgi:hypothetical protein